MPGSVDDSTADSEESGIVAGTSSFRHHHNSGGKPKHKRQDQVQQSLSYNHSRYNFSSSFLVVQSKATLLFQIVLSLFYCYTIDFFHALITYFECWYRVSQEVLAKNLKIRESLRSPFYLTDFFFDKKFKILISLDFEIAIQNLLEHSVHTSYCKYLGSHLLYSIIILLFATFAALITALGTFMSIGLRRPSIREHLLTYLLELLASIQRHGLKALHPTPSPHYLDHWVEPVQIRVSLIMIIIKCDQLTNLDIFFFFNFSVSRFCFILLHSFHFHFVCCLFTNLRAKRAF